MKEQVTINGFVCTVTDHNINVKDSYKLLKKDEIKAILKQLKEQFLECETFKRKESSLVSEWRTHSRLYRLGIFKSHTVSVDLNYPIKWYVELIYNIFGI